MPEAVLKELATQGLLGLLLVISLVALWWKDNQYSKSVDARIKEADDAAKARLADQKETTALAARCAEQLTRMQELTRASDERSARLIVEFEKLRELGHERELREAERDRERDQRERERELRTTGAYRPVSE